MGSKRYQTFFSVILNEVDGSRMRRRCFLSVQEASINGCAIPRLWAGMTTLPPPSLWARERARHFPPEFFDRPHWDEFHRANSKLDYRQPLPKDRAPSQRGSWLQDRHKL